MASPAALQQLNLVILGHVDHGKSTVIGRLLAETQSLPEGKLEQVQALCRRTARPFEYAFLLDALRDEQDQGITIDAARCFFKTARRRYLVFDAPGHVEFLRNMITGAAKAEAAFLVIDAQEGVKENSRRHGYIASMLGLTQISVLINKMDLVGYRREAFDEVREQYARFLAHLNVEPVSFLPLSAREGENMVAPPARMPWYDGPTVLGQLDDFTPAASAADGPLRLPVQDIYKFTEAGDDRRIFAGTVLTGRARVGDEVVFLPSGKRSRIATFERFAAPPQESVGAGEAVGLTLETQIYVKPGELLVRAAERPAAVGTRLRANLFWMGRAPMIRQKRYKLKLGTARVPVELAEVLHVLDRFDLTSEANKQQVDRHDVAECILETLRPLAFDAAAQVPETGRFVLVDGHDIAAAGVVLERLGEGPSALQEHVRAREFQWVASAIGADERAAQYGHGAQFVVFTGPDARRLDALAGALERRLFDHGCAAYCLRWGNVVAGLDRDLVSEGDARDEHLRRVGELARILTDAGQVFVTAVAGADDSDRALLAALNEPHEVLFVAVGEAERPAGGPALHLPADVAAEACVAGVWEALRAQRVLADYDI